MSLLHHTYQKADLEDRDYGFILALVCMGASHRGCQRNFCATVLFRGSLANSALRQLR
jgi:hypothetical protein